MKKLPFIILILALIMTFALADYFINLPGGIQNPLPLLSDDSGESVPDLSEPPNVTRQLLDASQASASYSIEKRTRSTELFEQFDLSAQADIAVYKNLVIDIGGAATLPLQIYEVQGPAGQGNVTYLNLKLAMIEQLGSAAGINETGQYGYNSLFYNDENNPGIGFLLTQSGDTVFGFKYSKEDPEAFDFIRTLVNNYTSQLSN